MCSRRALTSALSRALAERLMIAGVEVGRAGFLGYLKALNGATVKVVPNGHSAGVSQTNGHNGLKVICGNHTGTVENKLWTETGGTNKKSLPFSVCSLHVQPSTAVVPNMGTWELAEALKRVLPFAARDDSRPVLACVCFTGKEGKLTLATADGFTLAVQTLDCPLDGNALINHADLVGIVKALQFAKRVKLTLENTDDFKGLALETDGIRYTLANRDGTFPDYARLIPADFKARATFDSAEAIKAIAGIVASGTERKAPAVDLFVTSEQVSFSAPDNHAEAIIKADTDGELHVRLDGRYLITALKACGGMVDLQGTNSYSPVLFALRDYRLVVMPMMTDYAVDEQKRERAEAVKAQPEAGTNEGTPAQPETPAGQVPETTETPADDRELVPA